MLNEETEGFEMRVEMDRPIKDESGETIGRALVRLSGTPDDEEDNHCLSESEPSEFYVSNQAFEHDPEDPFLGPNAATNGPRTSRIRVLPRVLTQAGSRQATFFNIKDPAGHVENAAKHRAAALYFRYHYLSPEQLRDFIAAAKLTTSTTKSGIEDQEFRKIQYKWQNKLLAWYQNGVEIAVEQMGDVDVVAAMNRTILIERWAAYWDMAPGAMAKASIGPLNCAVPLRDIFSDNTEEHRTWQRLVRVICFFTCNDTFNHRILANNRSRAFDAWCSTPHFKRIR